MKKVNFFNLAIAAVLIILLWIFLTPKSQTTPKPNPQPGQLGFITVVAGNGHTCAITTQGKVMCWGDNLYGQLGDGTTKQSSTPVEVNDLSGVTALALGAQHTCALLQTGGVKCWGLDDQGQLGAGTIIPQTRSMVDVINLPADVIAISASGNRSCVLTRSGRIKCWGDNKDRLLSEDTKLSSTSTPVDIKGLGSGITALVIGGRHICVLTTAGKVLCWGNNQYSQLGDGTTTDRSTPAEVPGLPGDITALTVGSETCALSRSGRVFCWGDFLNPNFTSIQTTPMEKKGLPSGIIALTAGDAYACALTKVGAVLCWGANEVGQLGDGTTTGRLTPGEVSGLSQGALAISAGSEHVCVVMLSGGIKCWGSNEKGQLGINPVPPNISLTFKVPDLTEDITEITAGSTQTCALTSAGAVKCWGADLREQSVSGTLDTAFNAVDVSGLSNGVIALSANGLRTCVLTSSGEVICWKNGAKYATDLIATDFFTIASGGSHNCGITWNGAARCWGYNTVGQLGDGTTNTSNSPVQVKGLDKEVKALGANYFNTCALTTDGQVKCWGDEVAVFASSKPNMDRLTPTTVAGLENVTAIAMGGLHVCALDTHGVVKCWGNNRFGQLGNDKMSNSVTPVEVEGLGHNITMLAAGDQGSCAASEDSVFCWGTIIKGTSPKKVEGLTGKIKALAIGSEYACALTDTKAVWCWVNEYYAKLLLRGPSFYLAPMDVFVEPQK